MSIVWKEWTETSKSTTATKVASIRIAKSAGRHAGSFVVKLTPPLAQLLGIKGPVRLKILVSEDARWLGIAVDPAAPHKVEPNKFGYVAVPCVRAALLGHNLKLGPCDLIPTTVDAKDPVRLFSLAALKEAPGK